MSDTTIVPASTTYPGWYPAISPPSSLSIIAAHNTQLTLTSAPAITPRPETTTTAPSLTSVLRAFRMHKSQRPAGVNATSGLRSRPVTVTPSGSTFPATSPPVGRPLPEPPAGSKATCRASASMTHAAMTAWVINSWSQAQGDTPAARVIELLCRADRPTALSGDWLGAILTSLPDGPHMSQRSIANLFYLSNTTARPEALALVINRWSQAEGKTASNKLAFLLQQRDCLQNLTAQEFFIAQQFLQDMPNLALKTIANRFCAARAALRISEKPPSPASACDDSGLCPSAPASPALSLADLSEVAAMPSPYQQHYGAVSRSPSPACFPPDDADKASLFSPALAALWVRQDEAVSPSRSLLDFCERIDTLSPLSADTNQDELRYTLSPLSTDIDEEELISALSPISTRTDGEKLLPEDLPQLRAAEVSEAIAASPPARQDY